ncbi:glycosyltransferase involved in cell wall biosynthesis [Epilithonimonas hungarica]|uniref:glycosyltransferase n=1 Tax=Epilithonimonas hungarica TaxID=454006 RepID=UPI00278B3593|nr:glycosyltransferase [Epilithonimonas hungarica]MDP9954923.1 glycosyltransferase involved in cell wall biosynthesis [Epilithonimonas hungarica]
MEKSKKVLIVTYYWPPAGGPGVQRWLKFAKYLPEFDWKPIIYTPENPSYPLVDETLTKEVPENLKIIKTNIWEPYQLAEKFSKSNKKFKGGQFDVGKNQSFMSKLSIFIRGNFFIPDARKFWVRPSIQFLKQYLKENNIDVLVTTGPPHSLHLIGLGLKKELPNLKWIADFRDPWTEISYYKHLKLTSGSDRKHRQLEKSVFENADLTLATSYTDAENFKKNGANAFCITNGFDESENSRVGELESERIRKSEGNETLKSPNPKTLKTKFTLSYVGVLEQLRNPENLWKALENLCKTNSYFANDLELKFVGRVDDKILNEIESSVLKNNIKNLGYLSHNDSVNEMQNSDLLLITNFPNESSKGIIPGKLFEYLATGKQIISFGPKDADVETILNKTKAGKHFDYQSNLGILEFISSLYEDWKSGKSIQNEANINEFSRKELTKKLVELLDEI